MSSVLEMRDVDLAPNLDMEDRIIAHLEKNFCDVVSNAHFLQIKPFPYVVLDNFLPDDICEFIEDKGRNISDLNDNVHMNSKKKAEHRYWKLEKDIRDCVSIFYGERFVEFLEKLTGIEGLIPDADYNWGGGYHFLPKGGFLNVHKDFNIHPHTKLYRRLNLLIYLNKGWSAEDGGQLEFWEMEKKRQISSIVPVFNRAGLFETNEISYHGNPNKITRSDGYERMAYNLYYYTEKTHDAEDIAPRTTVYVDIPWQYTNRVRKIVHAILPKKIREYLVRKLSSYSR